MNRTGLLLLFACAFCFVSTANAQVQTGTPPFGTFGGGPDVINLANLNSQLVIPVVNKRGRGLPFIFDITHDSSIWMPVTSGSTKIWQSPSQFNGWGWNTTEANIGAAFPQKTSVVQFPEFCDNGLQEFVVTTNYSNWVYTDGFNIAHPFSGASSETDDECTGQVDITPGFGSALDGSGYTIEMSADAVTQLLGPDGSSITPNTGAGSIRDRNGNLISIGGNGVVTDTLGQAVITPGGTSNTRTFTYVAPSGANATYTEKFTTYTVRTHFACSGISEFGPASTSLVSEIDLPDDNPNGTRDRYTFTYEATPGFAGDVTGRIASVTLPTGGTISYSYSGGTGTNNSGIVCVDGSTATLTRTTPDGTWTYAHTEGGQDWTTAVTDPQGSQTVYNFVGIYQTERKTYQGTSSSGTLLQDEVTCYNGNTSNCNTTGFSTPITERIVTDTLGSQQCKHVYLYHSNFLTEQDDYDYGNGAPSPSPIRKELITYASLGNNILGAPSQITIEDGSGTVVAQTTMTYDETAPAATSGTPQHLSITGSRGNPTTIKFLVAGTTNLTKSISYFDTGNVQTATDVNGAQTGITYGACGNSFPTSIAEPLSLTKSISWNCTGGVQTSVTDENGQITSTAWTDSYFWRPASSTDQVGNLTNFNYSSLTSIESSMNFNGGNSVVDILKTLDSLGRVQIVQQREAPSSGNFDSVESDYDTLGRTCRGTVPYVGTSGQRDGTPTCTETSGPATTQTYDGLNRPLVTTDGGGGQITLTYTGNDVLQSIGPAPAGENPKRKQSEYNSIGQLTSVCEVTSLNGSGACGQNTPAAGYLTTYTYDSLGDLKRVAQSGQTRTYNYDDLGRMTSETNPETGTIQYVYDTDAICGTSNGDLVKKTDAAGNVICFAYDPLHRVTSITYPSGPNSGNTPGKFFVYDSATVNSVAMVNAKSHLAEAYTATCQTCSKITDEGFSYTSRGEVSDVYESTPHSGGYFHLNEVYWANGAVNRISGLSQLPTLTYGVDGEGRPYSVSASSGQNPVTSTFYNAASETTLVNFGSGDGDSFAFDSNTFRMTQYKYTVGATPQSVVGNLGWNANGTLASLGITDPFNAANTQNCTYSYDDLARLASGNCGSVWSQTFSFDAFGNITKSGGMSFQPGYNLNNQMLTGTTYDLNGDVLRDSLHSFAWNSDTRPTTIDAITVTYDALGRMVERSQSGTNREIVYDCTGNKLALMNGLSTIDHAFAALPAGATAVYLPGGLWYYRHADWLGSSRFSSLTNRTMHTDLAFAPYGEQYAVSGGVGVAGASFAGNNEDTTTNLYDAQFREYEIYGRWPSPDPAGVAAANPANPQSWNRYAYVLNNPLLFVDPQGLMIRLSFWYCDPYKIYYSGPCQNAFLIPGGEPEPLMTSDNGDSGGGGGGGNGNGVARSPASQSRLACAADFGQNHSIAALFGAQNSFLGNLLGGNTVSGLVNLGRSVFGSKPVTGGDIATTVLSGGGQGLPGGGPGFKGAAGQASDAIVAGTVSATYNAITGAGQPLTELGISANTVATSATQIGEQALSDAAFGVGVAKFLWDLGTVTYGYLAACK